MLNTQFLSSTLLCLLSFSSAFAGDDPHSWLELKDSPEIRSWVSEQNQRSAAAIASTPEFAGNLEMAEASLKYRVENRVGYLMKGRVYRVTGAQITSTPLVTIGTGTPTIHLDTSQLELGEKPVLTSFECLNPDLKRCLVFYTRAGKGAFFVEADLTRGTLIRGGFSESSLEGKNRAVWIDRNHLLIGIPAFGQGSATGDLYPNEARLWKRGTPIASSRLLLSGQVTDIGLFLWRVRGNGKDATLVSRWYSQGSQRKGETYIFRAGALKKIRHPEGILTFHAFFDNKLLMQLYQDWKIPGSGYLKDDIVGVDVDNGRAELIHRPAPGVGISDLVNTGKRMILAYTRDVRGRVAELAKKDGRWQLRPLEFGGVSNAAVRGEDRYGDALVVSLEDFIAPLILRVQLRAKEEFQVFKENQAFFSSEGLGTLQLETVAADGTRVPYFVVGSLAALTNRMVRPTLLHGYGAFGHSLLPKYIPLVGKLWLERGGYLAIANGRGGGEFGPEWWRAGAGRNKKTGIGDFISVAEDLLRRGYSSPDSLGAFGASAGGFLAMSAGLQRTDLFKAVTGLFPVLDVFKMPEYAAEYGDPSDPTQLEAIRSYSPYELVPSAGRSPAVLLLTSTEDQIAFPFHSRKMVAKMKELGQEAFLHEREIGAHTERTGYQEALYLTFLQRELGLP